MILTKNAHNVLAAAISKRQNTGLYPNEYILCPNEYISHVLSRYVLPVTVGVHTYVIYMR